MYKNIFEGKKAVIFDLDGTVINSEPHWQIAVKNTLELLQPLETVKVPAGYTLDEIWNYILDNYELDQKMTVKDLIQKTYTEFFKLADEKEIQVTEGFWSFAAELKLDRGYKLGLITNTVREITNKLLERFEFNETFDYTLCADEVTKPKPDPEMYHKAVHDMGFSNKEVLVFEDSIAGVTASVKAKLDTIVIWDAAHHEYEYPTEVLGFVTNFKPFPGNFDKNMEELIKEEAQKAIDFEKLQ